MRISDYDSTPIHDTEDALRVFRAILRAEDEFDQDREQFWILGINWLLFLGYWLLFSMCKHNT